jgi:hypothetical protein
MSLTFLLHPEINGLPVIHEDIIMKISKILVLKEFTFWNMSCRRWYKKFWNGWDPSAKMGGTRKSTGFLKWYTTSSICLVPGVVQLNDFVYGVPGSQQVRLSGYIH